MSLITALVKLEFIAVVSSTRLPRRSMGRAAATVRRRSCVGGGGGGGAACTGLKFTLLGARFDLLACNTKLAIENTRFDCALVARTANVGYSLPGVRQWRSQTTTTKDITW